MHELIRTYTFIAPVFLINTIGPLYWINKLSVYK